MDFGFTYIVHATRRWDRHVVCNKTPPDVLYLQAAVELTMKRLSVLCLCALVTAYGHKASQAPSYAERGSDLGIQVFQQVVRSKPLENVVLSPHGVASILGMLLPGAHGDTRKQVLNGLRYKKNGEGRGQVEGLESSGRPSRFQTSPQMLKADFVPAGPYRMLKKLHKTLTAKSNQDVVLIANAMFSQDGFPMEEAFVTANKANFQCESRSLDFGDPRGAADEINKWVGNKTKGRSCAHNVDSLRELLLHAAVSVIDSLLESSEVNMNIYPGHIPSLIKADMLDPALTRLVAVDAIYFKGLWKSCFQPEDTKMRPFTGGNGEVLKVPMMSQLSVFSIGERPCGILLWSTETLYSL